MNKSIKLSVVCANVQNANESHRYPSLNKRRVVLLHGVYLEDALAGGSRRSPNLG